MRRVVAVFFDIGRIQRQAEAANPRIYVVGQGYVEAACVEAGGIAVKRPDLLHGSARRIEIDLRQGRGITAQRLSKQYLRVFTDNHVAVFETPVIQIDLQIGQRFEGDAQIDHIGLLGNQRIAGVRAEADGWEQRRAAGRKYRLYNRLNAIGLKQRRRAK